MNYISEGFSTLDVLSLVLCYLPPFSFSFFRSFLFFGLWVVLREVDLTEFRDGRGEDKRLRWEGKREEADPGE